MSKDHPFYSATYNGRDCYSMTVEDRVKRASEFDLETCHKALALPGLQTTVRQALERRIRKLEREVARQAPATEAQPPSV